MVGCPRELGMLELEGGKWVPATHCSCTSFN